MYALIPNKDTLFALAACQRKLAAAFSEHFAPHLVACPTYPLWAFTSSPLPPAISACRILAPRLLEEAGLIAFPVELVSPCGTSSPSPHASPTDGGESPSCAEREGNHLCVPATPATQEKPSVQCERQEERTAVEAASASEEVAFLARRRVCPLLGGGHFLRSEDGASPCDGAESPLVEGLACASKEDSGSQLVATLPLLWGGHSRVVDTEEGRLWQLSIVAACVLQESAHWGIAHGLSLEWQPSECAPFPRSERVFRVGKVELEGTGWRLVHERWCKVN